MSTTTTKVRKNNPFPCIFTQKTNGKTYYVVKVTINRERRYVGCFKTQEEAVTAHANFMEKNSGLPLMEKAPATNTATMEGFL